MNNLIFKSLCIIILPILLEDGHDRTEEVSRSYISDISEVHIVQIDDKWPPISALSTPPQPRVILGLVWPSLTINDMKDDKKKVLDWRRWESYTGPAIIHVWCSDKYTYLLTCLMVFLSNIQVFHVYQYFWRNYKLYCIQGIKLGIIQ